MTVLGSVKRRHSVVYIGRRAATRQSGRLCSDVFECAAVADYLAAPRPAQLQCGVEAELTFYKKPL